MFSPLSVRYAVIKMTAIRSVSIGIVTIIIIIIKETGTKTISVYQSPIPTFPLLLLPPLFRLHSPTAAMYTYVLLLFAFNFSSLDRPEQGNSPLDELSRRVLHICGGQPLSGRTISSSLLHLGEYNGTRLLWASGGATPF